MEKYDMEIMRVALMVKKSWRKPSVGFLGDRNTVRTRETYYVRRTGRQQCDFLRSKISTRMRGFKRKQGKVHGGPVFECVVWLFTIIFPVNPFD